MSDATERLYLALANRYAIEHEIGAGGMATVYLAHDVKHDRQVAVKVLRPELAAVLGAERFIQEIKTTANLQHPHFLPLFDSGEADSFLYYVMPFIDGETLRDKLNRETQLGIDEAVNITTAIADALDYAHRNNVIHRDIKPENILLHDGRPMVADFGIALALSAAAGGRMTETGMSLGTPHYMSPEQATAEKDLTNRSDIYSLGCVLYEMLTGEPPHIGGSAQQIIMKIVTDTPRPVTELRKSVPPNVTAAVAKALERLAADRFESAAKFGAALTDPSFTLPTVAGTAAAASRAGTGSWNRVSVLGWGFAAVAIIVALWGWLRPSDLPPTQVVRYRMAVPMEEGLAATFGSNIALSPDGARLVYSSGVGGNAQLWLRERNQLAASPVSGSDGAWQPFFSPDGQRVAFITGGRALKVISLSGEPPVTLVDSGIVRGGGSWGEDGYVYFVAGSGGAQTVSGLLRMRDIGGPLEQVTTLDTERDEVAHLFPDVLPNGRGVLFTVSRSRLYDAETQEIAVIDLETGVHKILLQGIVARWMPTGHLVVVRADGALLAAPFDDEKLELTGPAMPLLDGVRVEALASVDFALSATGTIMYEPGDSVARDPQELVWTTREGLVTMIDSNWTGAFNSLALSPDGTKLAVGVVLGSERQLWIKQLDRGPLSKLTFDGPLSYRAAWTPNGRDVAFVSNRDADRNLYLKRADGSAVAEVLLDDERPIDEAFYSGDGDWLVYRLGIGEGRDIYGIRPGVDSVGTALVATEFEESAAALSPDGRWLAYRSNESGRPEVYVRPFPNTGAARWQVSTNGGTEPLWAHSGRELFYVNGNAELVSAQVSSTPTFKVGAQRSLFSVQGFLRNFVHRTYDVSANDQRFAMIRFRGGGNAGEVIVVENFFEELKAKVGRE